MKAEAVKPVTKKVTLATDPGAFEGISKTEHKITQQQFDASIDPALKEEAKRYWKKKGRSA